MGGICSGNRVLFMAAAALAGIAAIVASVASAILAPVTPDGVARQTGVQHTSPATDLTPASPGGQKLAPAPADPPYGILFIAPAGTGERHCAAGNSGTHLTAKPAAGLVTGLVTGPADE